jgi:hypothetical protein
MSATTINAAKDVTPELIRSKIPFVTPISPKNGDIRVHAYNDKRCPTCDQLCYCLYSYAELMYLECSHCGKTECVTEYFSLETSKLQRKIADAFPVTYGASYIAAQAVRKLDKKQSK